jgi:hypothetical protein
MNSTSVQSGFRHSLGEVVCCWQGIVEKIERVSSIENGGVYRHQIHSLMICEDRVRKSGFRASPLL